MTAIPTVQKTCTCTILFLILLTLLQPSSALPTLATTPTKCKLTDSETVILFFLANYASHALTVPSVPGGIWKWSFFIKLGCVFYPFAGLIRSVILLFNHWYRGNRGGIGAAIVQGAVMIAVRSPDWRPAKDWEHVYVGLPKNFDPPRNEDSSELPTSKVKLEIVRLWPKTNPFRTTIPTRAMLDTNAVDVHGENRLPRGYHWSIPSVGELNALAALLEKPEEIKVARTRSWLKGFIALAQLIFSSITIYQTRGDQLLRYGYAAFGLSVFPYTLMSLVNLIVTAIIGEYSHLTILRTAISDEAKKRPGGKISGDVGILSANTTGENSDKISNAIPQLDGRTPIQETSNENIEEQKRQQALKRPFTATTLRAETKNNRTVLFIEVDGRVSQFLLVNDDKEGDTPTLYISASTNAPKMDIRNSNPFDSDDPLVTTRIMVVGLAVIVLLGILPYILIFLLTRFRKGHSTHAERAWMMTWLVFNQILAQLGAFFSDAGFMMTVPLPGVIAFYISILIYATPAIGGFVMVGKMLLEFSPCTTVFE